MRSRRGRRLGRRKEARFTVFLTIFSLILASALFQTDQIALAALCLLGTVILLFNLARRASNQWRSGLLGLLGSRRRASTTARPFVGLPNLKAADARWRVTQVIDGDTSRVSLGGEAGGTVRLVGIDAPESVHPDRPVEFFGKISTAMALKLMLGELVRLEQDDSQGSLDDYGRVLAYVWLENGTLANEWLVKNGYAREQMYFNRPCKYRYRFVAAQAVARRNRRGMWAN